MKVSLLIFAGIVLVGAALTLASRPLCSRVSSWDSCKALPMCSPAYVQSSEPGGPVWRCASRVFR
jgi:hypothetical protein